jgi:hypothetical protein
MRKKTVVVEISKLCRILFFEPYGIVLENSAKEQFANIKLY